MIEEVKNLLVIYKGLQVTKGLLCSFKDWVKGKIKEKEYDKI